MITEDQSEVIDFLSRPSTHAGMGVERLETHSSLVFLAGDRAWKLKRAVKYDYLDFSTAERRGRLCEAEVRINRRTAPEIYHRAVAVTRDARGALAIGGAGVPVDWVVEMSRFPQEALFDRLAERGALTLDVMRPLGAAIAAFHQSAAVSMSHGGRAGMASVVEGNAAGFGAEGASILDPDLAAAVTAKARQALERCSALLEQRRRDGCVRQCHGDLHLRNIVLLDSRPTLFDAIEFNDDLACIDVLYDLSFLVMDLWRRRLQRHANESFRGYMSDTMDLDGLAALPLFLSCRAAIRAKTSATSSGLQQDPARRRELEQTAREYLRMAEVLLRPPRPRLVAVGGWSGTGKSTVARLLAPRVGPVPGALVLRSDETRKRLCGVEELTPLGPDGYTPAMSKRVYDTLTERAVSAISAGHAAIVDAVFARAEDRQAVERAAAAAGVGFIGLWLDAPEAVLIERIEKRSSDASDADAVVVRDQIARGAGNVTWHRIDASRDTDWAEQQAAAMLERVS